MAGDSEQFWDEVWEAGAQESPHDGADALLLTALEGIVPGRALDMGCGDGSNAVWLAKRGWSVTGVDFSRKAVQAGRRNAATAGAEVEFIVADAAGYQPQVRYDLITSFYIHLPPDNRAAMLSNMRATLKPGGMLLFVSHDRSTPPSGWSKADLGTLTSVEEVVSELQGMEIERAEVVELGELPAHDRHDHGDHAHGHVSNSTVVVARAKGRGLQSEE